VRLHDLRHSYASFLVNAGAVATDFEPTLSTPGYC